MRQILGITILVLAAFFLFVESKSTAGFRVLVLLDEEDDKNLYTKFFGSLESAYYHTLFFNQIMYLHFYFRFQDAITYSLIKHLRILPLNYFLMENVLLTILLILHKKKVFLLCFCLYFLISTCYYSNCGFYR